MEKNKPANIEESALTEEERADRSLPVLEAELRLLRSRLLLKGFLLSVAFEQKIWQRENE